MIQFKFNPKKSAQAAAVLLKLNDGDMDKYLFIKMLYLADRESLLRWEEPLTGDIAVSMQYGPVLSNIYDLTKGDCPWARNDWSPFISDSDPDGSRIRLLDDPGTDELSRAEIAILEKIFKTFNDYTWRQMRDYAHSLPEFEDPGTTSKLIYPERIFLKSGKTGEQIHEISQRLAEIQRLDLILS
jgi:uncharacterized phage-associated protein